MCFRGVRKESIGIVIADPSAGNWLDVLRGFRKEGEGGRGKGEGVEPRLHGNARTFIVPFLVLFRVPLA